jgi:hypothetical protein
MASEQRLFDLFGELTAGWPAAVQRLPGIVNPGVSDPELSVWLAALNSGTAVKNTRFGADSDRASVEAQLTFDNAQAAYAGKPDAFPFVIASMPDVEFRIQTVITPKFVQFFASLSNTGVEVVLEGLPVEILLPNGLIQPVEADPDEVPVGKFDSGTLDGLKVVYRRFQPTSVFVHIRLIMTTDNEFIIRPAVPINFGRCLFSEAPVKGLHNFHLIPSPSLVPRNDEWVRHTVKPWLPKQTGPLDGLFSVRCADLDEEAPPFKDIAEAMNSHGEKNVEAEFVLDDVVVPFFSPYVIPIPRHITIGLRRRVLEADSITDVFAFSEAPVQIFLNSDPEFGFLINSFFYKSLPSEDLSTDLGLTFSAVVFFDGGDSDAHGFEISLDDHYTPLLGYRRDFSSSDGMPVPGEGAAATINKLLHWEIATIVIDIMGFRGGYSLGRAIGEDKGFADCFELTGDLFVSMPPTGSDSSFFRMRALDGQPVKFAIEGIGWKQGSFHFEGLALPDGVAIFFGPVKLIIEEFGLLVESGATYLSFSGGLGLSIPTKFSGAIVFKRLRFRVSGNPTAPKFKLDGFFVALRFGSKVRIDAGGFYTEKQIGTTTLREFGFTGAVGFEVSGNQYLFAIDVLAGELKDGAEKFDYLMFQIVFRGSVPIAWFELRGVRFLFARDMQPKLTPANNEAYELRYYNWYKTTDPVTVTGDRRLAAWQPQKESWALGIGLSASLAQLGKIIELTAFVLSVSGDDENGLLIVAEAHLLQNEQPVAFVAVQWDGKNDQFSMLIGVNLTPKHFLKRTPDWIDQIGKLSGTLFICNKPVVVALGRLADTRTWFSLTFDFDVWARFFILFGICFEYSEAPNGGQGFGFIARFEGTINGGIVKVNFNAGFGGVFAVFKTASNDYAASFWIEAGLRIVLFRFLKFGISARAEFRNVGADPSRGELRAEIRLETPWYLPDVTWTFDATFGELDPAGLAVAAAAMRSAMAIDTAHQKGQTVHVERIDPTWTGEGVAATLSVRQLRTMALDEAGRLARFAADAEAKPIATDSTVGIEFSVAINDNIGIGGAAPGQGNQNSGDLLLSYDLIGLAVRRRARFGPDRNFYPLQQKIELAADFSDPNGVDLSGTFEPQQLTLFWSQDVQIQGQTSSKKLLVNSKTPYDFQTKNSETDEEGVKNNPSWPCCGRRKTPFRIHEVLFRTEEAGADVAGYRLYSQSQSRFRFVQGAYAFPINFGTVLPPNTIVAVVLDIVPGVLFRADLDETAAICFFRLFWNNAQVSLQLIAFDGGGQQVGLLSVSPKPDFQDVVIPLSGPPRRLEARAIFPKTGASSSGLSTSAVSTQPGPPVLALDRAGYVGLREYLDYLVGIEACNTGSDEFQNAYSGRGAVAFLPNYEYEMAVRTRITVTHPSKAAESVEVLEYLYFKTKGLPGLNAVNTVGEEVAPYVRSAYDGGRGTLYREEPVVLIFTEDFHVAVPISLRPPGTSLEHSTLLRMKLVVRPVIAPKSSTPFTATAKDWIVDHRGTFVEDPVHPYRDVLSVATSMGTAIRSVNPFRARLAVVTGRPGTPCPLEDPLDVTGTTLIAFPQGEPDPLDATKQLWPAGLAFTANVKPEGAGFVDRSLFIDQDLTALSFAFDTQAGGRNAWSVKDGVIETAEGTGRRFAIFGDADWNYITMEVTIAAVGQMTGVGVGLPVGAVPSRGLFAAVLPAGSGNRLAVFRRLSGAEFDELATTPLPASPDSAEPLLLTVVAFDDRLRASVGDTTLEVEREELREGRVCLVTAGVSKIESVRVTGLDIYRFPFQTSRYRSFEDHIQSFDGVIDVIAPDALGPGTTASTIAAVLAVTSGDIATAMQPDADPAARQSLFERWVQPLGLPLKDEVNALEISRFVVGGKSGLFVIESPEPLDFTEEIKVTLARRDHGAPPPLSGTVGSKVDRIELRKQRSREDLAQVLIAPDINAKLKQPKNPLLDVTKHDTELEVRLDLSAVADPAAPLLIVEVAGKKTQRTLIVYSFKIPRGASGEVTVRAVKTDEIVIDMLNSSLVPPELANLAIGTFALVSANLKIILGTFVPGYVWTQIAVRLIQDAAGAHALIVPANGAVHTPLVSGTYRIQLTLDRQRWPTTDAPDELNRYTRAVTLQLTL